MSVAWLGEWSVSEEYPGYELRVSQEHGELWVQIRKGLDAQVYSLRVPSSELANAHRLNDYVARELRSRIAEIERG